MFSKYLTLCQGQDSNSGCLVKKSGALPTVLTINFSSLMAVLAYISAFCTRVDEY